MFGHTYRRKDSLVFNSRSFNVVLVQEIVKKAQIAIKETLTCTRHSHADLIQAGVIYQDCNKRLFVSDLCL